MMEMEILTKSGKILAVGAMLVLVLAGMVIGKTIHQHSEQVAMNKAKFECEKDLPRSQNCVLEWKFVPEVKDEK